MADYPRVSDSLLELRDVSSKHDKITSFFVDLAKGELPDSTLTDEGLAIYTYFHNAHGIEIKEVDCRLDITAHRLRHIYKGYVDDLIDNRLDTTQRFEFVWGYINKRLENVIYQYGNYSITVSDAIRWSSKHDCETYPKNSLTAVFHIVRLINEIFTTSVPLDLVASYLQGTSDLGELRRFVRNYARIERFCNHLHEKNQNHTNSRWPGVG